jgi:hypothetical protein
LPGVGEGTSSSTSVSGRPGALDRMAFIVGVLRLSSLTLP